MAILVYLVLFLAHIAHSSATYCVCKDGLSDTALQKSLDYACGAGADCTPILQNGACYQPNTVKDHCSYAVNSYFQRKGQVTGSCDFSGTAATSATPPSGVASTCVYPSSPGNTGTGNTTPTTGTGTGTSTGTGTNTGTGTGTGITTNTPTTSVTPFGGLGPSGSGTGIDNSGVATIKATNLFFAASLSLSFSGLFLLLWG